MANNTSKKKSRSPWVDELRDSNNVSTENHMQMFTRLLVAGMQGIHNSPGSKKPKGGGK